MRREVQTLDGQILTMTPTQRHTGTLDKQDTLARSVISRVAVLTPGELRQLSQHCAALAIEIEERAGLRPVERRR